MEIKRVLTWYLVILVLMAGGVYLGLELFVNDSGPGGQEEQALQDQEGPATVETPSTAGSMTEQAAGNQAEAGSAPGGDAIPSAAADIPSGEGIPDGNADPGPEGGDSSRTATPAVNAGGDYTVQVAALSSRPKADELTGKLAGEGFPSARIAPDAGDDLNRVWVGAFATRAEAAAMAEQLKGKGYNTYVRTMP